MVDQLGTIKEVIMGSIHLIRIPDKEVQKRAITVLSEVQITRVRFPGDIMGVTDEHIQALKKANIPFQYVSKEPVDGQSAATVQP
jgi:hypothetical protein